MFSCLRSTLRSLECTNKLASSWDKIEMFNVWNSNWIKMQIGFSDSPVTHTFNWNSPTWMRVKEGLLLLLLHRLGLKWTKLRYALQTLNASLVVASRPPTNRDSIKSDTKSVSLKPSRSLVESLTTEFLMAAFSVKPCAAPAASVFLLIILTRYNPIWRTVDAD